MENPEHRDWTFGTQISELDGKYLILYSECDTSRVSYFISPHYAYADRSLEMPFLGDRPY